MKRLFGYLLLAVSLLATATTTAASATSAPGNERSTESELLAKRLGTKYGALDVVPASRAELQQKVMPPNEPYNSPDSVRHRKMTAAVEAGGKIYKLTHKGEASFQGYAVLKNGEVAAFVITGW